MRVRQRMSLDPVVTEPGATVDQALGLMKEFNVRHLPVVDGREVVGLVTDLDLRSAWLASQLEELVVADLMEHSPMTIHADETVYQAARLLHQYKLTGLLVTDGDQLVGIITLADMLEVFLDAMGILTDSVRLNVSLKPGAQSMEEVHSLICGQGCEVISVGMISAKEHEKVYSIRLTNTDLPLIKALLEKAGHKVLD